MVVDKRQHAKGFVGVACRLPPEGGILTDGSRAYPTDFVFLKGDYSGTALLPKAKVWDTLKEARTACNRFAARYRCHALPISFPLAWAMKNGIAVNVVAPDRSIMGSKAPILHPPIGGLRP